MRQIAIGHVRALATRWRHLHSAGCTASTCTLSSFIHCSCSASDDTLQEAKQKDGSIKDAQLIEQLSNLILDLEYLHEVRIPFVHSFFFISLSTSLCSYIWRRTQMKFLEDNPPTAGGLKLGVVPISGVIVGYFYRYENELITVLDVWGGACASQPPFCCCSSSLLLTANLPTSRRRITVGAASGAARSHNDGADSCCCGTLSRALCHRCCQSHR